MVTSGHGRVSAVKARTAELLRDLQQQVRLLETDLERRAADKREPFAAQLAAEHAEAVARRRVDDGYTDWLAERIAQVAAAWVLGCVFVRFAEDNELVDDVYLAGPGERLAKAEQTHESYVQANPNDNDRDYLIAALAYFKDQSDATRAILDENHSPIWSITPSYEAADALIRFWRRRGPDGEIVHRFDGRDENGRLDTRFLGDLYEYMSEYAQKKYALRQTPVFVEEFILDLTLEPALEDFPLHGFRAIDPACGSGHFLLGLFHRLLAHWERLEPGTSRVELVRRAFYSVHGCDRNPHAAAIARFRLHLAALDAAGAKKLSEDHGFRPVIAVGDSLLAGGDSAGKQGSIVEETNEFEFWVEDTQFYIERHRLLERGSYHAVVANPPYITVRDKMESERYRETFGKVCYRQYSLAVPFAVRLFQLAVRGDRTHPSGHIGQITANSFMKREFGKILVQENFAKHVELTKIIDTSGAYIPGHGTPTVILIGRNQHPYKDIPIRAVLGVRGEPGQPEDPQDGLVWNAIVRQVGKEGSASDYVTVEDVTRGHWATHPWSVSGGGAGDLFSDIVTAGVATVGDRCVAIGRTTHTGSDESYFAPPKAWQRLGVDRAHVVDLVEGDVVRDWHLDPATEALFPYGSDLKAGLGDQAMEQLLWMQRVGLSGRVELGGTHEEVGLTWFEWSRWHPERFTVPLGLAFAFVSTHNHFVLDRGGRVFNRSAPVIKLPLGGTEDRHLELLGILNSSTACFWLKQVCQGKGNRGGERSTGRWEWEEYFEFSGTKLRSFPLPKSLPLEYGRVLDSLAGQLAAVEPKSVCIEGVPTREALNRARVTHEVLRTRIIALQEELDWFTYGLYGLLTQKQILSVIAPDLADVAGIRLGERAFEIVLAAGKEDTQWFARHGSAPVTEIPRHWPEWYRAIVQARVDLISKNPNINLIERPEYKRRWSLEPWERREAEALRGWLLDRTEDEDLWYTRVGGHAAPRPLTINQLADRLRRSDEFVSVAELYAQSIGKVDVSLEKLLTDLVSTEHVPYLARLCYKATGLRKRARWEAVWEAQREEDRIGVHRTVEAPPKYSSADFAKHSYWAQRGKLDVPKERFVSYPDASPSGDGSLLLGWAGWNRRDQAQALVSTFTERVEQDGIVLPDLLVGLEEIMPWIAQWHADYDADWGGYPAQEFTAFLDEQHAKHGHGGVG